MTEHLPECPLGHPCQSSDSEPDHVMQGTIAGIPVTICGLCMADCICHSLRACEQRVLDAAREAVAALLVDEDGWDQHDEWMNDALAAIDALKEKQ